MFCLEMSSDLENAELELQCAKEIERNVILREQQQKFYCKRYDEGYSAGYRDGRREKLVTLKDIMLLFSHSGLCILANLVIPVKSFGAVYHSS
jgi:flagellar biosynthesis/type III secretory pathway protein FliH